MLLKRWKAEGAKVLIFSYSTQMLDILEDFVTREACSSQRLDGTTSTARRGKLVKDFNANPNEVHLPSLDQGGWTRHQPDLGQQGGGLRPQLESLVGHAGTGSRLSHRAAQGR